MERSVGVNPCVFCAQSRAPLLKMQQKFTFSVKISCFYWTKSFPSFSLIRRLQVQAVTRPRRPLALGMGGRERSFQTADCFCLLRVRPARMPKERANEGGKGIRRRRALSCYALKGRPTALHKQSFLLRLPITMYKLQFGEEGGFFHDPSFLFGSQIPLTHDNLRVHQ